MIFFPTRMDAVWILEPEPKSDMRGSFTRAWCADEFAQHGIPMQIVQSSLAWTKQAGTIRGLHFQNHPHWEQKVVRCVRGAAYVVAVDLRPNSPTHRQWTGVELTADNRRAIFVDVGCAQGYQTLVDDTELLYQMSTPFEPTAAAGYRYDDPAFSIEWPLPMSVLSQKDESWEPYSW